MSASLWLRLGAAAFLCLALGSARAVGPPGSDISMASGASLVSKGKFGGKLYTMDVASVYKEPVYVLSLHGTSFQQGFDAAYLFGEQMVNNYNSLMIALLGEAWWEPAVQKVVGAWLQHQWDKYLSLQTPQEYKEELHGLTKGGYAAGREENLGSWAAQAIVLANLPGTLTNIKYIIEDEHQQFKHMPEFDRIMELLLKGVGMHCSMFGVWGSRTEGGRIFTGRNLDWAKSTGISDNKLITIYHPSKGNAHATIGYAGLWGALTGISAAGLTVHEANLESDDTTFNGFPWTLRLRHVMSYAGNIAEAKQMFAETNNTVGFNHMVGSARDTNALCLETMEHNTAYFHSMDEREVNAVDQNGVQTGFPLPEAVYRTNHGYDPYTLEHYIEAESGYTSSFDRYRTFYDVFNAYSASKIVIGVSEAVNATAIAAHKSNDLYSCEGPYDGGSNVLSVTYDPTNLVIYAAWEEGYGDAWVPAACNTYVGVDLKKFF